MVETMAQPSMRMVTLTVTENGYGLARDGGRAEGLLCWGGGKTQAIAHAFPRP